jgi:thioesterase domain-containing protein
MAAAYLESIRAVQPSGPYLLGGWSIGGVIAFEMAQQLTAAGHEVRVLALIDSSVPNGNNSARSLPLLRALEIHTGIRLSVCEDDFEKLEREDQLDMVLAEMKRQNLAPPDADVSHARRYVHAIEDNLSAKQDYVPVPYPGEILLLHAQEPLDGQPASDMAIAADGWRPLARSLATHSISGNHVTMMNQPHVTIAAERLKQYLNGDGHERV